MPSHERIKSTTLRTLFLVFISLLVAGILRSPILLGSWFVFWSGYFLFHFAQEVKRKVEVAKTRQLE